MLNVSMYSLKAMLCCLLSSKKCHSCRRMMRKSIWVPKHSAGRQRSSTEPQVSMTVFIYSLPSTLLYPVSLLSGWWDRWSSQKSKYQWQRSSSGRLTKKRPKSQIFGFLFCPQGPRLAAPHGTSTRGAKDLDSRRRGPRLAATACLKAQKWF